MATSPLRCHLLIGAATAQRSALAAVLTELLNGRVLRPAAPAASRDSPLSAAELQEALQSGQPVIVDGGHELRSQRLDLLSTVDALPLAQPVHWIGWWLQEASESDSRQPKRAKPLEPDRAEGFLHVVALVVGEIQDLRSHCQVLLGFKPKPGNGEPKVVPIDASIKSAKVRCQAFELHAFSSLLAFERLIYLIQLLLHDPDLQLPETDSFHAEDIEARAARLLALNHGACYGDLAAVRSNLDWLRGQCFQTIDLAITTMAQKPIEPGPPSAQILHAQRAGIGFPAQADRQVFVRQLGLIRYLIHFPYDRPPRWSHSGHNLYTDAWTTERLHDESGGMRVSDAPLRVHPLQGLDETGVDDQRQLQRDVPLRDHLLQRLERAGVDYQRQLRRFDKDIETLITPYQLRTAMGDTNAKTSKQMNRNGYALGTAVFTAAQLIDLHQLIKQAYDRLKDPTLIDLHESLEERLSWSGVEVDSKIPVRAFANRSIIDPQCVNRQTMAHADQMALVEDAIRKRHQIRLRRHNAAPETQQVWPLQILFHNIGWYLAFESPAPPRHDYGVISVSRLDRLQLLSVVDRDTKGRRIQERPLKKAQAAQQRLQRLCERTGGIYLGRDLAQQDQLACSELEPDIIADLLTKGTLVRVRFLCTAEIFGFIREGNSRFPLEQMKISGPMPEDSWQHSGLFEQLDPVGGSHPYPVELILPCWTVENDFDFRRWLFGFGNGVRIEKPIGLRSRHFEYASDIRALYLDSEPSNTQL
mgnify:CR=1 FL=1